MTPLIGADLAYRKKQMFTVPVGEWFKSSSYDWLRTTLESSEMISRCFRPQAIESMLQQHRTGAANFTRELRALAAFALWDTGRALQA